ncbi:MAG: dockerin type I domain-containing protein, partial [Porcipelethomonas sp.]
SGGYAAQNDVTTVTASLDGETMLAAYSISVSFDSAALEFVNASSSLEYGMFYCSSSSDDSVTLVWSDSRDRSISGEIFEIEFKTKGNSAGQTIPVETGYSVMGSEKMEEIPFSSAGCEIIITENYKWGDANCDGRVSTSDVIAINKYCILGEGPDLSGDGLINADADRNGTVSAKDSKVILEYIVTKEKI